MADWDDVTIAALKELGADSVMVPGAKLRQKMVQLGYHHGLDVAAHVNRSTLSFSQLADEVVGVVVQHQSGSDVLVGLEGAEAPSKPLGPSHGGLPLRRDVYEAFTRLSATPFAYLPESDKFVMEGEARGSAVSVHPVSLETLLADRRRFIHSLPTDRQRPLIEAVTSSTTPLSAFRTAVTAAGMFDLWAAAQSRTVVDRVRRWAEDNGVTPRDAWFRGEARPISPHQTLARLAPYLTADEIRNLSIPFRAVEAMLSDIGGQ